MAGHVTSSSHDASSTRLCSSCKQSKSHELFSNKQWLLAAKSRRCIDCVEEASALSEMEQIAKKEREIHEREAKSKQEKEGREKEEKERVKVNKTALSRKVDRNKTTVSDQKGADSPTTGGEMYSAELRARLRAALPVERPKKAGHSPLLDASGDWFAPKAEAALKEIFDRFDHDHDGNWNISDSQQFAMATNGKPFTTQELNEILEHFERGQSGGWTCKGFLQFYHLQSSSHPDETWKDLIKLGYSKHLDLTEKEKQKKVTRENASKFQPIRSDIPAESKTNMS